MQRTGGASKNKKSKQKQGTRKGKRRIEYAVPAGWFRSVKAALAVPLPPATARRRYVALQPLTGAELDALAFQGRWKPRLGDFAAQRQAVLDAKNDDARRRARAALRQAWMKAVADKRFCVTPGYLLREQLVVREWLSARSGKVLRRSYIARSRLAAAAKPRALRTEKRQEAKKEELVTTTVDGWTRLAPSAWAARCANPDGYFSDEFDRDSVVWRDPAGRCIEAASLVRWWNAQLESYDKDADVVLPQYPSNPADRSLAEPAALRAIAESVGAAVMQGLPALSVLSRDLPAMRRFHALALALRDLEREYEAKSRSASGPAQMKKVWVKRDKQMAAAFDSAASATLGSDAKSRPGHALHHEFESGAGNVPVRLGCLLRAWLRKKGLKAIFAQQDPPSVVWRPANNGAACAPSRNKKDGDICRPCTDLSLTASHISAANRRKLRRNF